MTTAKSNVFNFIWVELNFCGEGIKTWWGGRGGRRSKFLAGGVRNSSRPLSRENFLYTYTYIKELWQQVFIYNEEVPYTSHASCAKVAILLLQDLSTLCVTDRYGIYMFSFVCSVSVRNTINLSRHEHV